MAPFRGADLVEHGPHVVGLRGDVRVDFIGHGESFRTDGRRRWDAGLVSILIHCTRAMRRRDDGAVS